MAAAWKGSRHGGTELLMLLAIADFADDDGNAYPSVGTLAKKCRMKQRNANYILRTLQTSGELEIRVGEGPYGTNRYRVNLAALALQPSAGVQRNAGVQRIARPPATHCANPLQPIAAKPSKNHQETPKAKASSFVLPDWVPVDSWEAWVEMRVKIKKPLTDRAKALALKKLQGFLDLGQSIADVLDRSTLNNWQDLFAIKNADANGAGQFGKAQAARGANPWEGAL